MTARTVLVLLASMGVVGMGAAYWFAQLPEEASRRGVSSPEQFSTLTPKAAPPFELKDPAGVSHKLEELKGNIVMVHFWASWCPPCVPELPEFLAVADRYSDRKLKLVAISLDDRWEDAAKMLPEKLNPNILVLWDKEGKLPESYGTYQFPETYLLNGELKIIAKWVGPQPWKGPGMSHLIEKALRLLEE